MSTLTVAAALAISAACAPGMDAHLLVNIAQHESGLNPLAVHRNTNGTTDYGMFQINDRNFDLLHITQAQAFDPCLSAAAAARLLQILSRYNTGSPTRGIGYATAVQALRVTAPAVQSASPLTSADVVLGDSPASSQGETSFR